MADRERNSAPPIPISEHSRVLIAMHKAMRADSQRLIGAVDTCRPATPSTRPPSAGPLPPSSG
jgi:hypothetical protein